MRFLQFFRYQDMTMQQAIDSFLLYIKTERRFSPLTVLAYSEDLQRFSSFLLEQYGVEDVETVTHLEVRDWQMLLSEQGYDPNSVRASLSSLRSFFRFLRRQGVMGSDIMAKVVNPKIPKRLPVFFTEKEVANIYDSQFFDDTFEGRRDQLLLCLLYETGIRRAEVIGLREQSVDFNAKTLKVLGKRDKERIIPLENEILHTIKRYFSLKEQIVGVTEAFFVRANGVPFTAYDVAKVVKRYMTAFSHADRISPHVFRHSFATHMLNEGADINAIKELLGHSDLSATEIYTHVSRQHIKETYKHTNPRSKKS